MILLTLTFIPEAQAVSLPPTPAWDSFNAPALILPSFENHLAALPRSGSVPTERLPWSDSYWQNNKGGITYRWNSIRRLADEPPAPGKELARAWTLEQIADLAPSEKYDLAMGHYDYPLTHRVHKELGRSQSWEGICHGWSAAALLAAEPSPVKFTNPDGIQIPFGSSDLKALLSYYYAWDSKTPVHNLGLRCQVDHSSTGACGEDANAGAFHIILANQLGIRHEGFIADVDRDSQVWNQPVYAFESKIISEAKPGRGSAKGTVKQVLIDTKMTYTDEGFTIWEPVLGTAFFNFTTVAYRYWLELNASNEIIGGLWVSDRRPDFIWTKDRDPGFTGDLAGLSKIYQPRKL